jgi:Bacterial transcriptional activator domain
MGHEDVRLVFLGPVRVRELVLGSGRRAAVLAVLALLGEVTREQIVAAVWGDDPPASANGNVYTHVNALRDILGGSMLTRVDGAYRLQVPDEAVDVRRFEALREQARRHRAAGDRAGELASWQDGLALWHGDALAGVPGPFAAAQRARLHELHRAGEQRHAELLLELGRPGEAITALGDDATADEVCRLAGLRGNTAPVLRSAVHAFFAEVIADSFGPPERVAAQLLLTAPAPLSGKASSWLLAHINELAVRSPAEAISLLQRAYLQHLSDRETHLALSVWLARLLFGQGRDAVPEASWVAARSGDPEVQAEMLWIAACSHDRQGHPVAAAGVARSALSAHRLPQPWLDRFRGLILRLRPGLPGDPTAPRHSRPAVVSERKLSAYRQSIAPDGSR